MNPTIKDVAKKANVSVATVSRVLNNLPGFSDKTKQKVLNVIKEIEYQPNAIARGLINKRTQTIGVMFPSVSSMLSSMILKGIEQAAHQHNFSVMVCNTAGIRTMEYLRVLGEKQVDGIIFTSEFLKDEYHRVLQSMKIPVLLVLSGSHSNTVPYVIVDDKLAAYQATEYLIKKGHTKIAIISGTNEDLLAGVLRINGFLQALQDNGIQHNDQRHVIGDFTFKSGCDAMEILLQRAPDTTAVFATSDEMAAGVLTVAAKHGIRVPEQLSVIGFDNLKLAEMVTPPLTTVEQPLIKMGEYAAEKLITMIETGKMIDSSIMPHRIVERQSVKSLI
jgi:LacI family transcriptional regulator